jgi:hypothetical protein
MTTVNSSADLANAFMKKVDCIVVPDDHVGNQLLIAGRVQSGSFPRVVLDRLTTGGSCKLSLGGDVVIPITKEIAVETVEMLDYLDEHLIELDVEEVSSKKINLYYGE